MIRFTRTHALSAGLASLVILAVAGWSMYFVERQRATTLALQLAETEPDVALLRRYEDDLRVRRAISKMRVIVAAYKVHYTQQNRWPDKVDQVISFLEGGTEGITDPWGNPFSVVVETVKGADGETRERVVVSCQPPGERPPLRYP
jgi:hypothetical protein